MAIEYNEFVAQATNRQTAINILRAKVREPLHFTSFSNVSGTAKIEGNLGLSTAANGQGREVVTDGTGALSSTKRIVGATNWTPSLSVKVNSGTDFQIGINATDDFWKGIMTPVTPATLVYYLRQGWRADLLSYLFIERLDYSAVVTAPDGTKTTVPLWAVVNSPSMPTSSGDAPTYLEAIRCRTLAYGLSDATETRLPVDKVSSLSAIAADVLGHVEAAPGVTSKYVVKTTNKAEFELAMSKRTGDENACTRVYRTLQDTFHKWLKQNPLPPAPQSAMVVGNATQAGTSSAPESNDEQLIDALKSQLLFGRTSFVQRGDRKEDDKISSTSGAAFWAKKFFSVPKGYQADLSIDTSLRSTEGLIYYLGEYVREGSNAPKLYGPCVNGSVNNKSPGAQPETQPAESDYCIPILVIDQSDKGDRKEGFIEIDFEGHHYVVPSSGERIGQEAGYSSEVITLVQQMLNLNRSAKDLPSTPLVRVIN